MKGGEIFERPADRDVFGAQCLLPDRQSAAVEGLGLGVLPEHLVEQGNVAQQFGKAWVVTGKALLGQRQRLLSNPHRRLVIALLVELRRLAVEGVNIVLALRRSGAASHPQADANEQNANQ